jgi:hypothetical protein
VKTTGFVFRFFVLDPIVRWGTFLGSIHRFEDMENGIGKICSKVVDRKRL